MREKVPGPMSIVNIRGKREPQKAIAGSKYSNPRLASNVSSVKNLENRSANSNSPPLMACDGIFHRMADLFLDSETTSYIDLYDDTFVKFEGYSDFKIDCKSPIARSPDPDYSCWSPDPDYSWWSPRLTHLPQASSSSTTSNSNVNSLSLDDSEIICDSSTDVSCNMDVKKNEWCNEDHPECGHDGESLSLFARPNFGA